jgi:hypothetical protein
MAALDSQSRAAWALARRQHWHLSHDQLLSLGFTRHAIAHRVSRGRLYRVRPRVYAVGRAEAGREGEWMAAVLSFGPGAVLSDESAAALLEIRDERERVIHVAIPAGLDRRQVGAIAHRRLLGPGDVARRCGIPVTTPTRTLRDLATRIPASEIEGGDRRGGQAGPGRFRDPARGARRAAGAAGSRRFAAATSRTFTLTDSELERRFLPIALRAGLSPPLTQHRVNGFRVDFYWPELGLVVETGWPSLSPNAGPAGARSRARSDSRGGRSHSAAFHPRADPLRANWGRNHAGRGRGPPIGALW